MVKALKNLIKVLIPTVALGIGLNGCNSPWYKKKATYIIEVKYNNGDIDTLRYSGIYDAWEQWGESGEERPGIKIGTRPGTNFWGEVPSSNPNCLVVAKGYNEKILACGVRKFNILERKFEKIKE